MFDQEVIGLGGGVTLGLAILLIASYLLINAKNAAAHIVAFFVVAIPLMSNKYLPGQVFDIRGLSPINFVTALAFIAVIIKLSLSGRIYGYVVRFLTLPVFICIFVFAIGVGLTMTSGGDHLFFQGPSGLTQKHSTTDFLLYEVIRPLQIFLVGLLVLVTCDMLGNKTVMQRAMLLAPIALSALALIFSLEGGIENYKTARQMLGIRMGMHGNGFGALSLYFLIAAITMREHNWPRVRYVAIGFAFLGIVLSYSRMAFVATILMLACLYFKLPAKERIVIGGLVVGVIILFSGQLIARLQFGLSDDLGGVDVNAFSAGRTAEIWTPGFKQFLQKPIFGYGIGMLVDSPTAGRINPHNAYLSILLDLGLVGFLAIANIIYWAVKYCLKNNDETLYLIMAMLILSLTGHSFYPGPSNYVVWVFYGMMLHTRYRERATAEATIPTSISDEVSDQREQLTNQPCAK